MREGSEDVGDCGVHWSSEPRVSPNTNTVTTPGDQRGPSECKLTPSTGLTGGASNDNYQFTLGQVR